MEQESKGSNEIRAKIIARAWKDEAFKQKLMKEPREALKEFGVELPGSVHMDVVEESANQFYFVLPQTPVESNKLSQTELEYIAAAKAGCNSMPAWACESV